MKRLRAGGLIGLTLILLGVAVVGFCIFRPKLNENSSNGAASSIEPDPSPSSAQMRVLFTGTTFWGRRTNKKARASELGVTYPFSQLDTMHREDYDSWIGGLECPVTDNGHDDYAEEEIFQFNCDPDYLPEASKYFTAFLLGNNHTDNQGPEGFAKTKEYLQENGIQYFGSYEYYDGENNCGVLVLPVNVSYSNGNTEKHKLPIGFCSAHGVFGIPTEANRANVEKYAQAMPTVVMPHMGAEYKDSSDTLRENLYHEYIDRGADAVIGDHPHWIQNAEAYNGRLIVYSMGNFMFDQATTETARSATIEAKISIDVEGVDFEAWDKISAQCEELNGDCYDEVADSGLERLKLTWKYDYHGTTTDPTTLIPHLANDAENAAIGHRLKWSSIPSELKQ